MTYLEVLTDICSQVADPDLDTYKDRAKDHFLRAISMLINENKYSERDIPGFIKTKTTMSFAGGLEDINSLKVFKILDLYLPPGTDKKVIITFQETSELNKISSIKTLQPTANDLFIYLEGNTLKAYTGSTPIFTLGTDKLTMKYIEDIDDNAWTDSTNLQDSSNFQLSYTFTRTCIDIASKTLLNEVKL
ncbi:MAG: hypothetical protein GWP19_00205 [Planctomycetia bacterium]|nr:hypothetical protein [Planctomycetia bacterium]